MSELYPYPQLQPPQFELLAGRLCYVLPGWRRQGVAALVQRDHGGEVAVRCGDWEGQPLDPPPPLLQLLPRLWQVQSAIRLPAAQYYFDQQWQLVDMRLGEHRFAGPGILLDLFGKQLKVPRPLQIVGMDEAAWEAVLAGTGEYGGELILKPSLFRNRELRPGIWGPPYVTITR